MKYYGAEMKTIHPEGCVALTWEDAEKMEKLNAENGWGFSNADLLRMIADHIDANFDIEDGNDPIDAALKAEKIEWRLEDANFHTLYHLLNANDYTKAIQWVAENVL